jgi:hypothetical protein
MAPFFRLIIYFFMLSVFTCQKGFAQTKSIALEENRLTKLYSKLVSFIHADYDSLSFYSNKFEKDFSSFIRNNPATMNYAFDKLIDSNICGVETSGDRNLRIYSWDTWTGGTMHFFKQVYQWNANGKVFTECPEYEEGDAGGFCSKIFTVDINDKAYYLVVTNAILSTRDAMHSISAYTIVNNKLIDTVKLFKTKTKRLNSIDVEFDFFSVIDRPEYPVELIVYDNKLKIIYIPVVDNKAQVTKKNILYQLKDGYFEFIGIETGKRN